MITLQYVSKVMILLMHAKAILSVNICAMERNISAYYDIVPAERKVSAYYDLVPNPNPAQPHGKYYWVKSAMEKLPSKCPKGGYRAGNTPKEVCSIDTEQRLGMENGDIPDGSITASSHARNFFNGNVYSPQRARLNIQGTPTGWCPHITDSSKWIQADLGAVMSITGLITQGYIDGDYVKSYKVAHCDDGASWIYVKNPDGTQAMFIGNTDGNTHVYARFAEVFRARFVRIVPVTWTGGNDDACMRFEVLGCK